MDPPLALKASKGSPRPSSIGCGANRLPSRRLPRSADAVP